MNGDLLAAYSYASLYNMFNKNIITNHVPITV